MSSIHQKSCLVDGRLIFIGSHNWTRGSLANDSELSVMTDDTLTIRAFLREFAVLTRQRDEIHLRESGDDIPLPIAKLPASSSRRAFGYLKEQVEGA